MHFSLLSYDVPMVLMLNNHLVGTDRYSGEVGQVNENNFQHC